MAETKVRVKPKMTAGKLIGKIFLYLALILGALVMLVPFIWMLSASLKTSSTVFEIPFRLIPETLHWENYSRIWTAQPLGLGFFNTTKLTLCTMILQITTSSFAAYAFAKLEFKGRDLLFMLYVMTISIPWQVYMVPQFKMMTAFSLTNSHLGIILMHAFTAMGVFMMRQFYMGIPNELIEAARIDGLSEYGIWWRIMLPLSKPAVATLAITSFTFEWNDFMGPLIYLTDSKLKTLQLMLRSFNTQYTTSYELIMAAATVFIVFIFTQRYFVEGVATSGLKG